MVCVYIAVSLDGLRDERSGRLFPVANLWVCATMCVVDGLLLAIVTKRVGSHVTKEFQNFCH